MTQLGFWSKWTRSQWSLPFGTETHFLFSGGFVAELLESLANGWWNILHFRWGREKGGGVKLKMKSAIEKKKLFL